MNSNLNELFRLLGENVYGLLQASNLIERLESQQQQLLNQINDIVNGTNQSMDSDNGTGNSHKWTNAKELLGD